MKRKINYSSVSDVDFKYHFIGSADIGFIQIELFGMREKCHTKVI